MLGVKFSLFSKIMIWFFLNLLLLGAIFLLIFGLNVRFDRNSPFYGGGSNRIEAVSRIIEGATDEKPREERDEILKRYSEVYKVNFYLFDHRGNQLGGETVSLPDAVNDDVTRFEGFGPRPDNSNIPSNQPRRGPRGLGPPGPPPTMTFTTANPTNYWHVIRILTFNQGEDAPVRTRLIVRSDSLYGYGLFFDPWPWIMVAAIIFGVSIIFWLPFVRRITGSIKQMTTAAEKIAGEDFAVRVDERRTDELGGLGSSINNLATRLDGFVSGQKRFLGDISHELNSPLARMQFALSILEDRVRSENQPHIADVKEEVELMSKLVGELLSYSKSGLQGAAVKLEPVNLRSLVENVVERETRKEQPEIEVAIDENITANAQPELLFRAVANVVRNSFDYAADGKVGIAAEKNGRYITLSIHDNGPGVPEDMLEKIFDPLFRVQDDRSRDTGGTGLGLAIVKTCVEACGGHVFARNRAPSGLEVVIKLDKP
ncbi:MAG: sensor histidine kinase [Pyrinomonadaceae bacterium]